MNEEIEKIDKFLALIITILGVIACCLLIYEYLIRGFVFMIPIGLFMIWFIIWFTYNVWFRTK
jgi:fatty-acid desaturase